MLIIDPILIGRKYHLLDPSIQFTVVGIADGTGTIVLLGSVTDGKGIHILTHKIVDATFI